MKEQNDLINVPLEFQIACTIRHIKVHDLLQTFINHVSFYASINKGNIPGYREATDVMSIYSIRYHNKDNQMSFTNKEHALKCIKDILAIGVKRGMNENKKRIKCIPIVKQLYRLTEHHNSTDKIYLDENHALTFTEDFSLMCDTHRHYPKEYLEYFMSRISLADADARVSLNKIDENPAMAFYELVLNGLGNLFPETLHLTELEANFIDSIQKFHYEVFLIRDLDERRSAYQEFYLDYYNKLINQSI